MNQTDGIDLAELEAADVDIAELNIARPRFALEDPRMAGFVDALDRVNDVAERSPGFVWRLTGESGDATSIVLASDPEAIVNLSVWRSVEALQTFVFRTIHRQFLARRAEWFAAAGVETFVMWPVPRGHRPSLSEADERLAILRRDGSGPRAFGLRALYSSKENAA